MKIGFRESLAAATAVTLIAGCTTVDHGPHPVPNPSRTLSPGPNSTRSDLRYNGQNAPYLLAINCVSDPKATYSIELPALASGQKVGEPWTVGDTTEAVPRGNTSRAERATFIAGITLRRLASGAIELADSDSRPGYTTTEVGPGLTWYTPIPGTSYELVMGIDGSSEAGKPASVSISCEQTEQTYANTPAPTPLISTAAV